MGQWQQQRKRKQIQEQIMDYASNLQGDIPTNLQMQTTTGEKVDVKLYAEIPIEEPLVNEEDKTSKIEYMVVKNKISMDCYHEIFTQFLSMPRSYKVKFQDHQTWSSCSHVCIYMQHRLKSAKRCICIIVPPISKTPGSFHGAQFKLRDSLMEYAEIEVCA